MDWSQALRFDESIISGELIISLLILLAISIFAIVVHFKFKHADHEKPEKGFVLVLACLVEKLESFVIDNMGRKWRPFTGYVIAVGAYIFICFIVGISGLPNPLVSLAFPLSIGLISFLMIHITAAKANKLGYFKRYIEPIPVLLPINLLSMWAPLLSLSLRLFGNALAGYCLMSIVYYFTEQLSALIFQFINSGVNQIFVSWIITPALHAYFDVFSGAIQTMVFVILTMIWVSQEDPEEEVEEQSSLIPA